MMEEPGEEAAREPQMIVAARRHSCWGRCGRRLRQLVPIGAWTEARELVKIGAPVVRRAGKKKKKEKEQGEGGKK